MAKKYLKTVSVGLISLFLVACSSSGITIMKQPLSQTIPPGKSVCLNVNIDTDQHKKEEDFQEFQTRLRDRLFAKLPSEGIFKSVVLPPEPADYTMDVILTNARLVSGPARIWGGVMAGHNDAQAEVKVYENSSHQLITAFDVDGTSASHPFSSESNPDDAIREAVNQIVKGLRQQ